MARNCCAIVLPGLKLKSFYSVYYFLGHLLHEHAVYCLLLIEFLGQEKLLCKVKVSGVA